MNGNPYSSGLEKENNTNKENVEQEIRQPSHGCLISCSTNKNRLQYKFTYSVLFLKIKKVVNTL